MFCFHRCFVDLFITNAIYYILFFSTVNGPSWWIACLIRTVKEREHYVSFYKPGRFRIVMGVIQIYEGSSLALLKYRSILWYFYCLQYPLDRVGQCVFHLWHGKNRIAHTIRFNTTYEPKEQESWLGSLYSKRYMMIVIIFLG